MLANHIVFRIAFIISSLLVLTTSCEGKEEKRLLEQQRLDALAREMKQKWVDSVYQTLSLEQRIGQLFMVAAYSGGEKYNLQHIDSLIRKYYIGGLIFMQGTADEQARQTNYYQSISKVPLLIGMDAEWGLGMRLRGVLDFPKQMVLGATQNEHLAYELGTLIAKQCKLLGVHINFAPVIDINNNPKNPVINFRSFGEDKQWVARLGLAYMRGIQDNGVLACAKHFPGHGDVDIDSHLDLPIVSKSKEQLQDMELYPFQVLCDSGVAAVMIAHLEIPSLDSTKNQPSTLSKNIVDGLLRREMVYSGLIITDALDMQGLTKFFAPGDADLKAFMAGNDVLLFSENVPLAISKIKTAIEKQEISEERLKESVIRILEAKYDAGLNQYRSLIDTVGLTEKLNQDIYTFRNKVQREAITAVGTKIPWIGTLHDSMRIAYIPLGAENDDFYNHLKTSKLNAKKLSVLAKPDDYDLVIVGVHGISRYPGKDGRYGLSNETIKKLNNLKLSDKTIFVIFGNAYALRFMPTNVSALVTYEEDEYAYRAVIDVLTGKLKVRGVLPVTVERQ